MENPSVSRYALKSFSTELQQAINDFQRVSAFRYPGVIFVQTLIQNFM